MNEPHTVVIYEQRLVMGSIMAHLAAERAAGRSPSVVHIPAEDWRALAARYERWGISTGPLLLGGAEVRWAQ